MAEMNIQEILGTIPHRYPFILIDKIIELTPGEHVVAIKNVTINEPYFTGHFPGNPVMPGVLIVEALAQASIVISASAAARDGEDPSEYLHYFAGIDNARFKQIVVPGDQLRLEARVTKIRREMMKAECEATVDGQVACSAELMSFKRKIES